MNFLFDQQETRTTMKPADSKRSLRLFFIFILVPYLFLFSSFALYHIYVANELDQSHGCDIGEWIHLGHQAVAALFLVSGFLLFRARPRHTQRFLIIPFFTTVTSRSPVGRQNDE